MSYDDPVPPKKVAAIGTIVFVVVVGLIISMLFGIKAFGRYQRLADARNKVKVSQIEIRNQEQRVLIAQQEAEIRHEQSKGVREAQDEIAKTLTPLYVQFEMVEAMKEIARSGSNSSVIFIPAGEAGIPIIQDALRSTVQAEKNE
jgi:hypothetical protein